MRAVTSVLRRLAERVAPTLGVLGLLVAWHLAILGAAGTLLPTPLETGRALLELLESGRLLDHVVASLFRVTWGFFAAVLVAVPCGLWLGLHRRAELAVAPLLEVLRPISPLAWIPLSILWFGVGDLGAVFIIFIASALPLALAARNGVGAIAPVHLQAGRNFGLSDRQLLETVVLPALIPRLLAALRLTLGIAWLVVVAAEMIAVSSGLGFLIVDARNAGNRYDQVVAGMVMIGVIGVLLDLGLKALERRPELRWCVEAR